jgi:hypothetical protein
MKETDNLGRGIARLKAGESQGHKCCRQLSSRTAARSRRKGNGKGSMSLKAADPRLLELLKLLDELPDREDQRTDRNTRRDRAVTLFARRFNEWVYRVLAVAVRAATSSLAKTISLWLGKQAGAIEARIARYSEPFTKLELQSIRSVMLRMINQWLRRVRDHEGMGRILKWLQRPAGDNAGDVQKLLDEFERELKQVSQRAAGQPDPFKQNAPAEQGHAGRALPSQCNFE